jgi:hypothetical protein
MQEDKVKILKSFIENEIAQSDDQYQLSVAEMQELFKQAIKATEEVTGKEIDMDKFNEFLYFYKIMKVVEKVSEELRAEKYFTAMKKLREGK